MMLKLFETFASETDTNYNKELVEKLIIPDATKEEILSWKYVIKSYLNNSSFYNGKEKSWGHTDEGSYRVSDHWNTVTNRDAKKSTDTVFVKLPKGQFTTLSKTNKPVINHTYWHLGQYNTNENNYTILKSWKMSKHDMKLKEEFHKYCIKVLNKKYVFANLNDYINFYSYSQNIINMTANDLYKIIDEELLKLDTSLVINLKVKAIMRQLHKKYNLKQLKINGEKFKGNLVYLYLKNKND